MTDQSAAVARAYFQAWAARDFDALRGLLADDATFRGPLGTADNADECVAGLRGLAEIITDIAIQHIFADGPDVLTWYEMHTSVAPPVTTANWSHLNEQGKIVAIRATFDPRPLLSGS